ncbi:MAG: hypothetical protein ACKOED_08300 [Aestuariivirga sp.]|uniref:hypothetical protein n=1 Tax=Aestuariivirga sp. TaxID=2650926 RepID=UPI0038D1D698
MDSRPADTMRPTLEAFRPLTPSEERIIADLAVGEFDRLGDGLRPDTDDPSREVRAAFLRFLILGGDERHRPHEKGVRVSGGWISGVLDLEGARIPRDIGLTDCRFTAVPVLRYAVIDNLFLDGSSLPGLEAERLEARGGVSLKGADVGGEVRLSGSRLDGHLSLDGATIACAGSAALAAEGIQVRAVEMRGATIAGETRITAAQVDGDFDVTGSHLSNPQGGALLLNRTEIRGGFFLRRNARIDGTLDLTGASIDTLHDDEDSWPAPGNLLLNRCLYNALIGGPVDSARRLQWLARQSPKRWSEDFWPQPYERLAFVLREMGHDEDARAVLVEKERLQRAARRARASHPLWRMALKAMDGLLWVTVGYGRRPLLAFAWLFVFWVLGAAIFAFANAQAALKPNSPVVLRSTEWTMCGVARGEERMLVGGPAMGRASPGQSQMACFLAQPEASSYPAFNASMYSLDTLFPVLEIGQKSYWRPDPDKPWGAAVMAYYYFQALVGWALSLLAIAGFSGLVRTQ